VTRRQNLDRPASEIVGREDVSSCVGRTRRALEARCRGDRKSGVVASELLPIARRLLEVVADDLVLLDEGDVLVQPGGEPLVEVGAGGLRQPVVGGVADQ
jgi:hypothetical protein